MDQAWHFAHHGSGEHPLKRPVDAADSAAERAVPAAQTHAASPLAERKPAFSIA